MRHGYAWWEAFWKWLKEQSLTWSSKDPISKHDWLKYKYKQFEDLWRTGEVKHG